VEQKGESAGDKVVCEQTIMVVAGGKDSGDGAKNGRKP